MNRFHHPHSHPYHHMRNAENASKSAEEVLSGVSVHTNITCDGCGMSPIVGIRYKCTTCFDFDLCGTCEASEVHPREHVLLKIRVPNQRAYGIPMFPFGPFHHSPRGFWGGGRGRCFRNRSGCAPQNNESSSSAADVNPNNNNNNNQQQQQQQRSPHFIADLFLSPDDWANQLSSLHISTPSKNSNNATSTPTSDNTNVADSTSSTNSNNNNSSSPSPANQQQQQQQSDEYQFEDELAFLHEMGFTNDEQNLELLRSMCGGINAIIDRLTNLEQLF